MVQWNTISELRSYIIAILAVTLIYLVLTRRQINGPMEMRKHLKQVNYSRLLSKHDIIYMTPVARAFWFNSSSAPRGRHPHSNNFLSVNESWSRAINTALGAVVNIWHSRPIWECILHFKFILVNRKTKLLLSFHYCEQKL